MNNFIVPYQVEDSASLSKTITDEDVRFFATLFVEIRKRMGIRVFDCFHNAIINAVDNEKQKKAPLKST